MLDVAICNDNITEIQNLFDILEEYRNRHPNIPMRIRRFQSLYDLVDHLRCGGDCHLCFLDYTVWQPWMNKRTPQLILREERPELSIVGFTNTSHAAFLSPRPDDPLMLTACICKPLASIDLYKVLDNVVAKEDAADAPSLSLPTRQGQRALPFCRLVRAHCRNHVVRCYLEDGEMVQSSVLRVPFSQLIQPLLQEGSFAWVSASCVVNMAFVRSLDKDACRVEMSDGEIIQVPRSAFPGLRDSLVTFQNRAGS